MRKKLNKSNLALVKIQKFYNFSDVYFIAKSGDWMNNV